jgi:hypothetical protein
MAGTLYQRANGASEPSAICHQLKADRCFKT